MLLYNLRVTLAPGLDLGILSINFLTLKITKKKTAAKLEKSSTNFSGTGIFRFFNFREI